MPSYGYLKPALLGEIFLKDLIIDSAFLYIDRNQFILWHHFSTCITMLSYQHGYHAGNFADVIKHLTLSHLLDYMTQKDKPLLYLETHSGKGLYDLQDKKAVKTGEASEGIARLWAHAQSLPDVFSRYIDRIASFNQGPQCRYYPGSPALAIQTLRSQDRAIFCELHPQEFQHLEELNTFGKRVRFLHTNGMEQLKALLPPIERRGLIFIDPSYEIKTDYQQIPAAIKDAYQRFATGVYCIWYPLLEQPVHKPLLRGLMDIGAHDHLRIEFDLGDPSKGGMTGSGLWVINPPFTLEKSLKIALDSLCEVINPGLSSYLLEASSKKS